MNTQTNPIREEHLEEVARRFRYPSTPDVAGAVMKRLESGSRPRAWLRSAWVVIGLLVLVMAVLFAVPSVRAEIIRFFQVGVVRIFPSTPTQTIGPAMPQSPITATPDIFTPVPGGNEPLYSVTISGLAGETNLEDARAKLPFPIRLPEYPTDLGPPNKIFLQDDGKMVILVWSDSDNPERAHLSLHEIGPEGIVLSKYQPRVIQETQVDGVYAIWAQGPYLIQLTSGTYVFRRTVEGNTLIWEEDNITYRLESDLTLEETIRIAESLR
jgi:hypothetical protein